MKNRLVVALGLVVCGSIASVACAPGTETEEGVSDDNLTTSLSEAKTCAIRAKYVAADLGDFTHIGVNDLPRPLQTTVSSTATIARFFVSTIGDVYLVQKDDTMMSFYSVQGTLLASAWADSQAWAGPNGTRVYCAGASDDGGSEGGSYGDYDGGSYSWPDGGSYSWPDGGVDNDGG